MSRPQKYKIDNDYFSSRMTANKAYLLGLIYSDGSISKKYGRFSYICSTKDIEIIEFIKDELKSEHPIRDKGGYAAFEISNKKIVNDLINNFNLPEGNKSLNNLSLPRLPDKFMPHFVRGVFDGDGSIWTDGSSYSYAFTGGDKFLLQIADMIQKNTRVYMKLRYRYGKNNPRSCSIEIKGNKYAKMLYNYMYTGGQRLSRKHDKFLQAIELDKVTKQKYQYFRDRESAILKLYNNGVSQHKIADLLMCPKSSVRGIVQKNRKLGLCL